MSNLTEAWDILETELVYADHLKVYKQKITGPKGTKNYHTLKSKDWCNVIAITHDREVLIAKQRRVGNWQDSYEFPGGTVDEGESPLTAAVRELREETGYAPVYKNGTFPAVVQLGSVYPNPALLNNQAHTFLVIGADKVGPPQLDEYEDVKAELWTRQALDKAIRSGEFNHSIMLNAMYFLEIYERETGTKVF